MDTGPQAVLQSNLDNNCMVLVHDRQVDQWNRIKDPEMNPHIYGHLIIHKGSKIIQWKKRQHFQQMVLVQLEVSM